MNTVLALDNQGAAWVPYKPSPHCEGADLYTDRKELISRTEGWLYSNATSAKGIASWMTKLDWGAGTEGREREPKAT